MDASTVKVTLTRPSAPFIGALSQTTTAIISPASADKNGNEYKNIVQTVGTGPYVFKERKKGESFTVSLNDKYWGKKPDLRHRRFWIVPEAATRESHPGRPGRSDRAAARSRTSRRCSATRR